MWLVSFTDTEIAEQFILLSEKANQAFHGIAKLSEFGEQWEPYFSKTFAVFTNLWDFQQENRATLESKSGYELQRWELGEIASKIAQLYYLYYLRTSDLSYLQESYIFYDAIKKREYFGKEFSSQVIILRRLRYVLRFILVSLLLNKQRVVKDLVALLTKHINHYVLFNPADGSNWQSLLQELTLFLQADSMVLVRSPFTPKQDLRRLDYEKMRLYSITKHATMALSLECALVVDCHLGQIKFSEFSLDMSRMVHTLEPIVIKPPPDGAVHSPRVFRCPKRIRKFLLFRPSIQKILMTISSALNEIEGDSVMLLYFSCDGSHNSLCKRPEGANPNVSTSGLFIEHPKPRSPTQLPMESKQQNSPYFLYVQDLVPFLRRPLFLIIESSNSQDFLKLSEHSFGVPFLVLCSPSIYPERAESNVVGSLFTYFLNSPLNAFCCLVGQTDLQVSSYKACEDIIDQLFVELGQILTTHDKLSPSCKEFMNDPLLALLIMRFIFCYATLSLLESPSSNALPSCAPRIPSEVLLHPSVTGVIEKLASLLGSGML